MPDKKSPDRLCRLATEALVETVLCDLEHVTEDEEDTAQLLHHLRGLSDVLNSLGLLEDIVERIFANLSPSAPW